MTACATTRAVDAILQRTIPAATMARSLRLSEPLRVQRNLAFAGDFPIDRRHRVRSLVPECIEERRLCMVDNVAIPARPE